MKEHREFSRILNLLTCDWSIKKNFLIIWLANDIQVGDYFVIPASLVSISSLLFYTSFDKKNLQIRTFQKCETSSRLLCSVL
jgi:hypothetical protein